MKPIKHGNAWYTEDAEYGVSARDGRLAIVRGDGSYTHDVDAANADEVACDLAAGIRTDAEFNWYD